MKHVLFGLRTLSSLHCGIGQGMNDIDLPTARHPVSGHPLVPGSSLKGVMREEYCSAEYAPLEDLDALFGKEGNEFASAISVGDGILVALPVRSYYGTHAYLASPYTLLALKNMLVRSGKTALPAIPKLGLAGGAEPSFQIMVANDSVLCVEGANRVLLEELDLAKTADQQNLFEDWAKIIGELFYGDDDARRLFRQRFAITDDNALNFLSETGLPVDARIAIDQNTGTVKSGALWYEETVPAEALFAGIMAVDRSRSKGVTKDEAAMRDILTGMGDVYLQVGGKATTGKGFVALRFSGQEG